MSLIRRHRPSAPTEEQTQQEQVQIERPQPMRRMRLGARPSTDILARAAARESKPVTANSAVARAALASAAGLEIDVQLKLISEAERAIDEAQEKLALAYSEVERLLRSANMTHHSNGVYLAELAEQWTKQSRTIDPKKFKNHVANDVFWSCISVGITEAKKHLADKEIDNLSDVVPPKYVGRNLKIKKLEPKKRSK